MDDLLHRIIASEDPSDLMREAVDQGPVLRTLSQHIFYSFFSSYIGDDPATWTAQAAETALQLLSEGKGIRYGRDWLLETAFHGSLALAPINSEAFFEKIERVDAAVYDLERDGVSRSSQYVKGLLAYARDDLVAAERAFGALAGPLDSPLLAHHSGYPSFRAPGFYRALKDYSPELHLTFVKEASQPEQASTIFLCSMDDLYFAAFGNEFAEHALSASSSVHVHFHLINNTIKPSILADADVLGNERVSITVETTEAEKPGVYATMARYIVLPLLLQRWGRPVLVTDVDLTVERDPSALSCDHSVALRFSHQPAAAYIPVTSIIAHHSLFKADSAGMKVAEFVSRYLHYMCASNDAFWGADQIALLIVSLMFKRLMVIGDLAEIQGYGYGVPEDRPKKKKAAENRLRELTG
jgi:hypothetical protein